MVLSSYGLNMEDVRTALTQASVNSAKGNFDGPRQDYQIDSNDQITEANQYKNVVIAYSNGAPVFVKDVANVINGVENTKQAAWMGQADGSSESRSRRRSFSTSSASPAPTPSPSSTRSQGIASVGGESSGVDQSDHDDGYDHKH